MRRLVATIVAEAVALDAFTNRWSATNMVEFVLTPTVPAVLARLAVLTFYELDSEPMRCIERIRVLAPDERVVVSSETRFEVPARTQPLPGVHRSLHMLWGLQFNTFGEHRVLVERGDGEGDAITWSMMATRSLMLIEGQHPLMPVLTPSHQRAPSTAPEPEPHH